MLQYTVWNNLKNIVFPAEVCWVIWGTNIGYNALNVLFYLYDFPERQSCYTFISDSRNFYRKSSWCTINCGCVTAPKHTLEFHKQNHIFRYFVFKDWNMLHCKFYIQTLLLLWSSKCTCISSFLLHLKNILHESVISSTPHNSKKFHKQ